jgi:hypothetical protein
MKSISKQEKEGEVVYRNRSIKVVEYNSLAGIIPSVIDDMRLCRHKGQVDSRDKVFQAEFVSLLNIILSWIINIPAQALILVSALTLKHALKWLPLVMDRLDMHSDADLTYIENISDKL